jgi:hypothetical protein
MGQTLVLAGQTLTPAVLNRIYGTADAIAHTVNNTTYAQVSSVYSLPALDAAQGTAYRLYTFGNGTWGTAEAFQFAVGLAGTEIGISPIIAGTVFSNAAAFDFEIWARLICVNNGSSATWVANVKGVFTQSANAVVPGTAADNSATAVGNTHSAVTQDSTIANNFGVYGKWAGTTGTPTISCVGTLFEKVN